MSAPHLSLTALFHRFPDDYRSGTRFVRERRSRGVQYPPWESDNRLHATPRTVVRTRPARSRRLFAFLVETTATQRIARRLAACSRRWQLSSGRMVTPSWPTAVPVSPTDGSPSSRCPVTRTIIPPKKVGGYLATFRLSRGLGWG